jgi:hypothetical protein
MKKWISIFSIISCCWYSNAQTGIGTTNPNASAKLEIAATDKGILIPRMTKTQRESITLTTAANGLLVYQTDDVVGFYVNSSTTTTPSWTRLNSDWIKSGNNITYTAGNISTTGAITGGNSDTSSISGFSANITSVAANYSLTAADNGKVIQATSTTAITVTIPSGLPAGFNCTIVQMGAGQITFSGTYFNRGNFTKTASQYAIVSILHMGSNNIIVSGEMSN